MRHDHKNEAYILGEMQWAFSQLNVKFTDKLFSKFFSKHCDRAYHNYNHIAHLLKKYDECIDKKYCIKNPCITMAALYHDIVPDPLQSASYFLKTFNNKIVPHDGGIIWHIIVSTMSVHSVKSDDEKLFHDLDWSILAESKANFIEYEKQIQQEYGSCTWAEYKEERISFLHDAITVQRGGVYFTPWAQSNKWQQKALTNFKKVLKPMLAKGPCHEANFKPSP